MLNHNIDKETQTVSVDTPSQEHKISVAGDNSLEKPQVQTNLEIATDQASLISFWLGNGSDWRWSIEKTSRKTVEQPTVKRWTQESSPVLAWELLVTVGLLIMALWMQTPVKSSSTWQEKGFWNENPSKTYPAMYPHVQ